MELKEAAEIIVADRKKALRDIAEQVVANREPKTEINLPAVKPVINIPTPIVNIPEQLVKVETIVEDNRNPIPVNVTLVLPPDSIHVSVNPTINIPKINLPDITLPKIEIPATVIEVNVPEMPPPVIEVKLPPEPEKKDPPTLAVIEHSDDGSKTFVELK